MDVRATLKEGMNRLREGRVPSHTLAAELLLMHVLGCERAWLYSRHEEVLDPGKVEHYLHLVVRRIAGVPTQYLTGRQEFWGLEFEVTPDVLIPRPETEHVIEVALARLGQGQDSSWTGAGMTEDRAEGSRTGTRAALDAAMHGAGLRIADVGTGSGCLAVALAHELPEAVVVATDISSAALAVARRNAVRNGVAQRIQFVQCNLLGALESGRLPPLSKGRSELPPSTNVGARHAVPFRPPAMLPRFHVIVSNPPYVGRSEAGLLPREVREHEPAQALFAGEQGCEIYALLIDQADKLLGSGGTLVLEIGYNALDRVRPLFDSYAWTNVGVTNDLAGIPRVIAAEKL